MGSLSKLPSSLKVDAIWRKNYSQSQLATLIASIEHLHSGRSAKPHLVARTMTMSNRLQPPDLHMGDVHLRSNTNSTEAQFADHECYPCSTTSNRTPTPRTHSPQSSLRSLPPCSPHHRVYIVTDTCYPTAEDFNNNKGLCRIDSVHSSKKAANAQAKKIIFQVGRCKVDVDKIIEEIDEARGLYTGIGIGGNGDGTIGNCYARKCGVEGKLVDEDSEDEIEGDQCGDHQDGSKAYDSEEMEMG